MVGAVDLVGDDVSLPSLMDTAAQMVGTADWGDATFIPTAELFLRSCRETGQLNPVGKTVLSKVVLRHLLNRLHIEAYRLGHPGVENAELQVAVVVTGMPRTGTTLLHNLLALDPGHRFIRLWEALHPVPADAEEKFSEAGLVQRAEAWLGKAYELAPALRSIHPSSPQGPEECDSLFQNAFASHHFDDMFEAERYSEWLYGAALEPEYSYFALQLRVLGSSDGVGSARPWALKSPSHVAHLGALLATFPEALVVQCHRHPLEALPSYASLVRAVRAPYRDVLRPESIGAAALDRAGAAVTRALEVRESADPDRFLDVSYPRLIGDPIGVVGNVYGRLGRPLEPEVEAAMRRWLADNPQHKHGRHRYSLEEFGIGPGAVMAAFEPYIHRFSELIRG